MTSPVAPPTPPQRYTGCPSQSDRQTSSTMPGNRPLYPEESLSDFGSVLPPIAIRACRKRQLNGVAGNYRSSVSVLENVPRGIRAGFPPLDRQFGCTLPVSFQSKPSKRSRNCSMLSKSRTPSDPKPSAVRQAIHALVQPIRKSGNAREKLTRPLTGRNSCRLANIAQNTVYFQVPRAGFEPA